jgi:glycosyltransferase involved in cell wall biosynthesis
MAKKRLSIVTISYNQVRFLEKAILSVLGQNDERVEYIVVDAGSTDGSRDVIERYRARIDTVIMEPDRGPADGLNKGFAAATGDLYAYVNSDDELSPGAAAYAIDYLDAHPDIDVLCGSIRITDTEGRAKPRKRTPDPFNLRNYAGGICTIGQQATFIRRAMFEKVGGFNIQNRIFWDGELLVDMTLAGARFAQVRKVLGDFRIYPQSMTGSGMFQSPRFYAERERVIDKIRAHGIPVDTGVSLWLRRQMYRFNVLRHMRYLLAR